MNQESRWQHNYAALAAYAARENHSRVPADHVEDGTVMLGNWVAHQRQKYRRGCLAAQRIELLESLPGWEWGPLPRGPMRDVQRDTEMLHLRANGYSLQQVAERFGISRQRVHQIVNRVEVTS